ncbi:hypothetical protein HOLleu_28075 [Holothuria leucospilota]|uniref:CCHC-type domain-containing protein n=1 Tax=Holothuria leucospilota TaxID=206669 RepID=A0A9Q1H3X0_HOLLE|nr:hypothetical protein HOLleu_28075 [Holothuria leucospilota]
MEEEQLIPSFPDPTQEDMEFQTVTRKRRRTSNSAPGPEDQREPPRHHCKYPVILTGLPATMKNPIAIRKYIDANHPTAQVIRTTTSRTGHTIIAAQDETSQKTLLKDWKPIEGRRPTARLPKQKTARPETYEGVIIGLHPDITEEDATKEMGKTNGFDVISFRRFYRKGIRIPTWKAAVTFASNEDFQRALDKGVNIGYQHHRVEAIRREATPTQCHNCQRYGHLASNCSHRKTCLRCAGHHSLAECPNPRKQPKCANCSRSQIASYRGCSRYARALEELKKKTTKKTPQAQGNPRVPTARPDKPNPTSFCSPQIADLQKKHEDAIKKMEERHQLELEAIRLQHQATVEKIEEANTQLFHQIREDTTTQLNEMKCRIIYFLGDVLHHLIPTEEDKPPTDYQKATVTQQKAWAHLGLAIDISNIKAELKKKSSPPKAKKTSK